MAVVYHVDQHDGGFAYRVDDVWSETFPDHDTALEAAGMRRAASRSAETKLKFPTSLPMGTGNRSM